MMGFFFTEKGHLVPQIQKLLESVAQLLRRLSVFVALNTKFGILQIV